jgi:hypothetical protein
VKKLFLVLGCTNLVIGAVILLRDADFIHRYGVDLNDVGGADGRWTFDWETGTRPAYANHPAYVYGVECLFLASALLVIWFGLAKNEAARTGRNNLAQPN